MRPFRLPSALTLLVLCTLLAAALSYILPAGLYDRADDPATGRSVVVAGSYHHVPPQPLGAFEAFVAIPNGIIRAADVIAFVFLVGAAFSVIDKTGALRAGIHWLVERLGDRGIWAIPVVSLAFATGGAFEHMQEEIIALIPPLLVLTSRLGFTPTTAVSMSIGSAAVAAAFSPLDPFQVLIAQKVAHVPLFSGAGYRTIFLAIALVLWIGATMRYAQRTRTLPTAVASEDHARLRGRDVGVLAIIVVAFAAFGYGIAILKWDFPQEAALFFIMGIACGLVGGLGLEGTATGFIDGFGAMAYAALLIGFARAISVAMEQGAIIDTVVHGLAAPLAGLPMGLAGVGMMLVQAAIHVPVPSVSGQAVLTLPVFAPLADLLHFSRDVAVLAYQYGGGLCELVTPTNGALIAILAAAGVRYEQWMRTAAKPLLVLAALGALAVVMATRL
jgi:uncharacterized ion transporter superfamily protein YfcC